MSNETALLASLDGLLKQSIQGFQEVSSVSQLTAGASKQTFKVIARIDAHTDSQSYAYRSNGPEDIGDEQVAQISLATEARLLQLAGQHGVPAPQVLAVFEPSALEQKDHRAGFLMEWLSGETLGHKIVRQQELAEVRQTLATQCGEILGRIHSIDWQRAELADKLPTVNPAKLIDETWSRYVAYGVPKPMIDYTWRWLKDNIPKTSRQTLVHGDFRNGNLMVTEQGINAVLDWELAHIGDPIRDLGWLCVNSWRFGIVDKEVGGFGEMNDLLNAYEKTTGIRVAASEVKFWQVFGSFWWSTATLLMANSWRTGANKSVERPAIGRRSSEAQMDCVNLLFAQDMSIDVNEIESNQAEQLPLASELLTSVSDFLSGDLTGNLQAHDSFMAKVAANSLKTVERELIYGPRFADDEWRSLRKILNSDESLIELRTNLAEQLRDGLSLQTEGLQEHLRITTAKQLYIDQPTYSALKAALK